MVLGGYGVIVCGVCWLGEVFGVGVFVILGGVVAVRLVGVVCGWCWVWWCVCGGVLWVVGL